LLSSFLHDLHAPLHLDHETLRFGVGGFGSGLELLRALLTRLQRGLGFGHMLEMRILTLAQVPRDLVVLLLELVTENRAAGFFGAGTPRSCRTRWQAMNFVAIA
jgi:hypothetical protein